MKLGTTNGEESSEKKSLGLISDDLLGLISDDLLIIKLLTFILTSSTMKKRSLACVQVVPYVKLFLPFEDDCENLSI